MELATKRTTGALVGGNDDALVDASWLEAHLTDSNLRVVEVDVNRTSYDDWHVDGAVLWDIYSDLRDADYRTVDANTVARLLERSGIDPETTVVFYGYAPELGYWLLKLRGHDHVHVLNCSRDTWRTEGRPWSNRSISPRATSYPLDESKLALRATREDVRAAINDPAVTIVDVRSLAEYRGERFWPSGGLQPGGRAGHVPSAVSLPLEDLLDERGAFLPAADLRARFASVDLGSDRQLITYCTIGGRAATAWFVLSELIGRDHVRVYEGSWAEWGLRADTPADH